MVYTSIYRDMELKDLLLAVLLQKKYFKYRKNKMMSRTHDREENWNCLNLFLPLFLMLLKFNIAALLVPLLWMLHNPIIINLSATELELDYTLFSLAATNKCCQKWKQNGSSPFLREQSKQVHRHWDLYRQLSVSYTASSNPQATWTWGLGHTEVF